MTVTASSQRREMGGVLLNWPLDRAVDSNRQTEAFLGRTRFRGATPVSMHLHGLVYHDVAAARHPPLGGCGLASGRQAETKRERADVQNRVVGGRAHREGPRAEHRRAPADGARLRGGRRPGGGGVDGRGARRAGGGRRDGAWRSRRCGDRHRLLDADAFGLHRGGGGGRQARLLREAHRPRQRPGAGVPREHRGLGHEAHRGIQPALRSPLPAPQVRARRGRRSETSSSSSSPRATRVCRPPSTSGRPEGSSGT